MADTIISNTPQRGEESSVAWILAIVVAVVIAVLGFILFQNGVFQVGTPTTDTTNITITPTVPPVVTTPAVTE